MFFLLLFIEVYMWRLQLCSCGVKQASDAQEAKLHLHSGVGSSYTTQPQESFFLKVCTWSSHRSFALVFNLNLGVSAASCLRKILLCGRSVAYCRLHVVLAKNRLPFACLAELTSLSMVPGKGRAAASAMQTNANNKREGNKPSHTLQNLNKSDS